MEGTEKTCYSYDLESVHYTQIGENEFLWLPCINPTPIPSPNGVPDYPKVD